MTYNIDIEPASRGQFTAKCRELPIVSTSDDPEHDICHLLTKLGVPDGPVQFWRGKTPSLSHSSIHVMGGLRIKGGDTFPYRRVKRRKLSPETFKNPGSGLLVEPDEANP